MYIYYLKTKQTPAYFYVYFTLSKALLPVTLEKSLCRDINFTHAINEYIFPHSNVSDTDWITEQCYFYIVSAT